MRNQTFLVTGGAGFIGSHLVEALLQRGDAVRVLDNFATGRRENLAPFAADITLVEGDLRDPEAVDRAAAGADVILHQAALPSVPRSISDPVTTHDVNVTGTLNVLEAARRAGVRRVVFASSSSVYGNNPTLPKQEEMSPSPMSPYAVSKLAAEKYCQAYTQVYGLETVSLRYFNVFGPRQDPGSQYSAVIPKFITSMLQDEQPVIYGDGEQSRDFTYIENVVHANLLAAAAPEASGLAINCACGGRISLNDLVEELNRQLGKSIQPRYAEPRPGDVKHSYADITRARDYLAYQPSIAFEKGLVLAVDGYTG